MLVTMMMKILAAAAVVVLLVVSGCAALPALADERRAATIITSFEEWTMHHGKEYATTAELEKRRRTWLANQEHVEQHNAAYTAGYTLYAKSMHGPFADLDDNEFAASYLMEPQDCSATTSQHVGSGRLRPFKEEEERKEPLQVDWRTKGIMTPVKNQGVCGSCWTFSTSGCLEAHVCLAAGKDCTHWSGLAEEQLVDCAGAFNNHGCNGGLPSQAFEYLKYSGGMALEDDYPYHAPDLNGTEGVCHVPRLGYKAVVSEVFNITQFDEDDLVHAIAEIGPVSVAYQVFSDFRLYAHGVYDSYNHTTNTTMCHSGSHDVNHAVVAVGLGTTPTNDGVDYYIIRNSWSGTFASMHAKKFITPSYFRIGVD
jgi:cathepsin H